MAKSTRRAGRARMDVMEVWQAPKRSWPIQLLGVLIRWRVELALLTGWITTMVWLNIHTSSLVSWLIFAGLVLVLVVVRPTRWFLFTRMWCVLDRHRLRTCLRQSRARTMNLDGALPFMLWARPTNTGERVWLWARAGSSAGDLESVLEYVAPACYARDARVHRVRKLSTLMAVDVIRRDPLDKSTPIDSPLASLTSLVKGRNPLEGTEPINGATITPLSRTDRAESAPRQASVKSAEPARPAVVVNGEDLSDYID